jgi:hypothetical protein
MKHFVCTLFFISLVFNTAHTKIWTVDNTGKVANFNNLSAAISAAQDGDTILLGGSSTAYTDVNLAKKLCIIGPGYFLTENPNTIEYKNQATIASVTLSSESDGSVLMGITSTTITISTNNITIKRCTTSGVITVTGNNNMIKQNYCNNNTGTSTVNVNGTNNTIRNNYISSYYSNVSYPCCTCLAGNIVENNILIGIISITSSSFGNNILRNGNASFVNCNPYNSIGNALQFGTDNGNQSSVVMTNVFVSSGTSDGQFKLASSSPAKGAGLGGIDCGMFGGNDPYILSGIPDIPVITSLVVPGRANPANGLNVILNIRSNK